mmetsp:Transcript_57941/g.159134  ORF Transcript_57941/g.159134 Transcript_57941/m.159134 type:complete len:256 (-) Transcript_57941:66-833(-)
MRFRGSSPRVTRHTPPLPYAVYTGDSSQEVTCRCRADPSRAVQYARTSPIRIPPFYALAAASTTDQAACSLIHPALSLAAALGRTGLAKSERRPASVLGPRVKLPRATAIVALGELDVRLAVALDQVAPALRRHDHRDARAARGLVAPLVAIGKRHSPTRRVRRRLEVVGAVARVPAIVARMHRVAAARAHSARVVATARRRAEDVVKAACDVVVVRRVDPHLRLVVGCVARVEALVARRVHNVGALPLTRVERR